MEEKQKSKALELAIASVHKEFGEGAIMRLKDGEKIGGDVAVVPTGSLGLDIALGIGGYPRGRIMEIYGPESSGKTTLTLHAIASVQRQGGVAAFIDAEHALDVTYAASSASKRTSCSSAAGLRGAGARNCRHARALRRGRHGRHRLRGSVGPQGRDRRRHGRLARRAPGSPDEPGAAQGHGLRVALAVHDLLHQPNPHEDRRHVR